MAMLIPKDYRGELFRSTSYAPEPPSAEQEPAAEVQVSDETQRTSDVGQEVSLFNGIYDLLLGENSAEEETLLLLGIALLLLWGHLDRGGLFERQAWNADDIALLLIGYLLLS